MTTQKTCRGCETVFITDDTERKFLERLAPVIGTNKFEFSEPNLCHRCRERLRTSWRNERKLYKRKCDLCQKEIISVYSPDKPYRVACRECFWSDKWDPVDVGIEYDENKSFFEQFEKVLLSSKLLALFGANNENSDYVNQETDDKDCYMNVGGHFNRECYFCTYSIKGDSNVDSYWVINSNNLYECINCYDCANSTYLEHCSNCAESHYCLDCIGCKNCFGCVNLNRKEYHFFNEGLEKEEYERRIKEFFSLSGILRAKELSAKHQSKYPRRYARIYKSENTTGDYTSTSKDSMEVFWSEDTQDCRYGYVTAGIKDVLDSTSYGWAELCYNCASAIKSSNSVAFSHCNECPRTFYSFTCFNSSDLIGCVGLIKKQHCILNKQYTKVQYEALAKKIFAKMQKNGVFGHFMPHNISPFGYNETAAMTYFPLTKEKVSKLGAKWQENDYSIKYEGGFYEPNDIGEYDPAVNPRANEKIKECLNAVLKCEVTGKPFKILPQELHYYIKRKIQVPRRHPDQRHLDRLTKLNPMLLYRRQCMCEEKGHGHEEKCKMEFETTYSPKKLEKIYCERCYQKANI